MMEYKGYYAQVVFDEDANVFHGEVINLRDVITFEGDLDAPILPPVMQYVERDNNR